MPITLVMCKFAEGVVCERNGVCAGCVVWDKVLDQVSLDLDICPVCGADRKVWREKFGREHICSAGEKG